MFTIASRVLYRQNNGLPPWGGSGGEGLGLVGTVGVHWSQWWRMGFLQSLRQRGERRQMAGACWRVAVWLTLETTGRGSLLRGGRHPTVCHFILFQVFLFFACKGGCGLQMHRWEWLPCRSGLYDVGGKGYMLQPDSRLDRGCWETHEDTLWYSSAPVILLTFEKSVTDTCEQIRRAWSQIRRPKRNGCSPLSAFSRRTPQLGSSRRSIA